MFRMIMKNAIFSHSITMMMVMMMMMMIRQGMPMNMRKMMR